MTNDSDRCSGLSEKDLGLLADGKLAHEGSKVGVWSQDDVSPASFLLSYRQANAMMSWTSYATSYLDFDGRTAAVILHQDDTVLHLKDEGQFIGQYVENSTSEEARLRSFTGETIPFKQVSH